MFYCQNKDFNCIFLQSIFFTHSLHWFFAELMSKFTRHSTWRPNLENQHHNWHFNVMDDTYFSSEFATLAQKEWQLNFAFVFAFIFMHRETFRSYNRAWRFQVWYAAVRDCYNSQTVKKCLIVFVILPRLEGGGGAREGSVKVRHHLSDATRTLSVDHADGLSCLPCSSQHSRRTVPLD